MTKELLGHYFLHFPLTTTEVNTNHVFCKILLNTLHFELEVKVKPPLRICSVGSGTEKRVVVKA